MKAAELEELGFIYALTHWELNLDAPMLSGHRICLQYFESDQYKDAHLIVFFHLYLERETKK